MKLKTIVLAIAMIAAVLPAQARKAKKFTHETVAIPEVERKVIAVETARTQLLLQVDKKGVVRTVHYGAPTGDPAQFLSYRSGYNHNFGAPDAYPAAGGRFNGQEALHVAYPDGNQNTELYYTGHDVASRDGKQVTTVHLKDYVTALEVDLVYEACRDEDVILMHSVIRNGGKKPVQLRNFASASLRLEADSYELTHFHGGWADEMQAERTLLTHDTKLLESRRGTQNTQGNNPSFVLSLGHPFSETDGPTIAGALAWSGNFRISFELDQSNQLNIVSGISPFASAYPLAAGKSFTTPEMVYTWSADGAGEASRNLHRWARKYAVWKGGEVNPTLLNSWEGAYFSFNTETLLRMIDDAAAMGLEMFVLDDGWFGLEHPRNSDKAGLGDWELNTNKLPEGIDYVASYAHSKGLKFGIWIEPEMVNPDSNLAQAHPDWIVQSPGREIHQSRNQWILDLSNPAVQDFVFGVFDRTVALSKNIDYVKWDCNRRVMSFGSPCLGEQQDRFFVEYIQGLYSVCERMRAKYPDIIVQCCSAGGSRVDYGSMRWFNEVWTSDNTDAISRTRIQWGTSLVYPACVMAAHVSAVPNHQTGNVTPLKFRFDVASSGRLGMELQPRNLTEEERALADRCIRSYKGYRDLVFGGDLYRLASPYDGDYYSLMYVSPDKRRAVVFCYCLRMQNPSARSHAFRLQGLDPALKYRVAEQNVDKSCWWGNGNSYTGAFLSGGGFNPGIYKANTSAVFVLETE
ncbi:MAG: alpha-galactosidase [Bacteroidales bacterium]|nr:alpha-galactosidase [Bacteroidales bacterium]